MIPGNILQDNEFMNWRMEEYPTCNKCGEIHEEEMNCA